jgi:O-glycosyl hydrolase
MRNIILSTDKISPTNNGVFEGWGTSLCWWANRLGFSEKLIRDSAKLFFSKKDGLGLNIMRYNIGGGDDPTHNHIRRTDSEMPGWWKYDEEKKEFIFNPEADKNQVNMMLECYKASGDDAYVEAFSNSPPYYMTVSGCSSGGKNPLANNLKKSQIIPFAEYLAEVVDYIQSHYKIKIKSLAAMNEPFTNYWRYFSEKQEGCHVSPGKMQSAVLIATANALKERNLNDITVTASDETNTRRQLTSLKRLSKEALSIVDRISTHTYEKATAKVGTLAREKGKNIWMSETDWSSISGENSGEMGPALWLSEKIIEDMNTIMPSAWVIWQIVAAYISLVPDHKGRLDMPGIPDLNQGFWGTAFADMDKEEIYLTQKYYAFGQFSRYIRPGMNVVHTDKTSLGAYDKDTGRLVLVCVNTKAYDEEITIDFKSFLKCEYKITPVRTSGSLSDGEHWNELDSFTADGNQFSYTLKGNSVTTFIIDKA